MSAIRWLCAFGVGLIAIGFALAFSLPANYEKNKAHAKQALIWNYVMADNGKSGDWYNAFYMLGLFTRSDWVTGTVNLDVMPDDRYKLIHTVGAVAKATFVWVDNPYTGMFKSAKYAIVRLSAATAPSDDNLTPAISIKAFRDGMYSANTIGMYELIGWPELNYFQNTMCTHISENPDFPLKLQLLGKKFKLVSDFPGSLGLSEWAAFTESGAQVTNPKFPWVMLFQPNPALKAKMDGNKNLKVGNVLTKITNEGDVLFKIFAINDPWSTEAIYLGYIRLTSAFKESEFSDLTLFFKHTFIEKDFELRPDWKTYFADKDAKRWETEGQSKYAKYLPPWSNP